MRGALAALAFGLALGLAGCDDADDEDETPAPQQQQQPQARQPSTPPESRARAEAPAAAPSRSGTETVGIPGAGMGHPVAALTAEIPAGWRTRGGVAWNDRARCVASGLRFEWSASSADGTQAVEMIPGFSWQQSGYSNSFNPCPVAPITSAEQFLRSLARELYPGATVTGYVDLTPQLPPAQQTHAGVRNRNEAGRIALAYAIDGRDVKETLQTLVSFSDAAAGGNVSKMGLSTYVLVNRGTPARFDETLADRVSKSFQPNRDWFQAVQERGTAIANAISGQQRAQIDAWHSKRMAEISAKGMADRHAIRMNTISEVGAINSAGWKSRMESMDRQHRGTIDGIREVSRYADTSTGRVVELSNHYNHGFRTSSGAYVATDDPNFNPGAGGAEMNRVR